MTPRAENKSTAHQLRICYSFTGTFSPPNPRVDSRISTHSPPASQSSFIHLKWVEAQQAFAAVKTVAYWSVGRIITMQTATKKSVVESPSSKPGTAKEPDIASASVPDTLASLKVNPDTGLERAEVDTRRKENGYNEVAEKKGHPILKFLKKFWGISAWMLELIMVLSAVLKNYSDLIVVGALLVINAILGFMQEHRAAGVVATLRKRLQPARSYSTAFVTEQGVAQKYGRNRQQHTERSIEALKAYLARHRPLRAELQGTFTAV